MKLNFRILLTTLLISSFFVSTAYGQFVNFEDTWNAFLKENKTSNISKLPKPAKEEKQAYVQWNLMFANNFFCGGNIPKAEELVQEIEGIGKEHYKVVPGFVTRFEDLTSKIKAAKAAGDLWINFLKYKNVTLEDLAKTKKALRVCEKGTLAKYSYMMTYAHYCDGNLEKAKDGFENYLLKIVDKTSLKIEDVKGLKSEVASMRKLFKGLELLDKAWGTFIKTDESKGFDYEMPTVNCNTIPMMKVFVLRAALDVCHTGQDYLNRINLLKKNNTQEIPTDLKEKIAWLETEVGKYNGDLITLEKAWKEFVQTNALKNGITFDYNYCDQVARIKAFTMTGMLVCDKSEAMLDSINLIQKTFNPTLPKIVAGKVKALESKVQESQTNLSSLEKSWEEFVKTNALKDGITFGYTYCSQEARIKAFTITGLLVCDKSEAMLDSVNLIQKTFNPTLPKIVASKVKVLTVKVEQAQTNLDILEKSWAEFVKTNTLKNGITFGYAYCSPIARIKAFTMTGLFTQCDESKAMLDSVNLIQKTFNPTLPKIVAGKVKILASKVQQYQTDLDNLNKLWATYIDNKDTLLEVFKVEDFYCDHFAQVKSWVLMGHLNSCENGQGYLDKIDAFQDKHKLKYDEELDCRIVRLRIKVWDCRYWELVLQARKETHEERERFGPAAANIMKVDLNSEQQPCETTVTYKAVKYIGVKYVITTYLCQNIDLAKMGDPAYYQKIAAWVNTEVLKKYCESATMHCKDDFSIYLEGHADGNRFRGARYKKSLDIPVGTQFTHFVGNEIQNKTTERAITKSLKNNKELALARAWTVKQQLEFMNVPIFLGAAENEEKGGEYRKVVIELNIPNLLLDFYEKRLQELLEASGIGKRPEEC